MKLIDFHIDGTNFYRGLRDHFDNDNQYNWVDVKAMCERIKPKNTKVNKIYFYTAHMRNPYQPTTQEFADQQQRQQNQKVYLEALTAYCKIEVIYGLSKERIKKCNSCQFEEETYIEKGVDVALTYGVCQSLRNEKVKAIGLVSGDGDYIYLLQPMTNDYSVDTYVYFPPSRRNRMLGSLATDTRKIKPATIKANQLPDKIDLGEGRILERPADWR